MGKSWNHKAGQQWRRQPERAYQYWQGSYAVSPKHAASPPTRYDRVQLRKEDKHSAPSASSHPWHPEVSDSVEQSTIMGAIQRSLTAARKADGRTRRLQDEKRKRKKQWDQWVQDQKANFAKQRKQFEMDMQKIDSDLVQTAESGAAAATRIKEIVLGGAAAIPPPEQIPTQDDAEWERIMQDDMIVETAGFFHAAMQAAQTMPPSQSAGLGSVHGHLEQANPPPPPPPPYIPSSPVPPLRDPYMTSPVHVHATAGDLRASTTPPPGVISGGPGGGSGTTATPITPLRGTSGPAISPQPAFQPVADPRHAPSETTAPLAEKLSAKREERRSACHPFGLKPKPSSDHQGHVDTENAAEHPAAESARPPGTDLHGPANANFIDDDGDELKSGVPSPGFGTLE